MTKKEQKMIDKKNENLKNALENLKEKDIFKEYKNDMKKLLDFVRPEHMTNGTFNNECKKVMTKYIDISKSGLYDEFESEIILNSASQVYEFQLKAYLIMCYY